MSQWNTSESGILRKSTTKENYDDLLVFGYACKLFRDDEKALYIDQGKHLIPWMGDETLKIDRYDCRGALSDLGKYEGSKEGYDAVRWLGLSEKERNLEELCDKERYHALDINEEEEEMYKEEEEKRQKTNEIQYTYDVPQNPENKDAPVVLGADEAEEEYVPPPLLDVPVDIVIPKTVKENARIEKTALFVCQQGLQMEILIKAKQGSNPQFSFLNQIDPLYKFYRHVLAAFKSGRYKGYKQNDEIKTDHSGEQLPGDESDSHYLHPSLSSANAQRESMVQIPQVTYKPSVNCSYFQLVNRIQGTTSQAMENQETTKPPEITQAAFNQMTYEQQQYYQYYFAQQYYEYYKHMSYQQGDGGNPGQFVPPADFQNLDPNIQAYIQQIAYSHYLEHQQQQQASSNSYAQIVSNVNKDGNTYTANLPQLPETASMESQVLEQKVVASEDSKIIVNKPLVSLAPAYDSDSESDSDTTSEEIVEEKKAVYKVPTGEIQVVIDKLALYVSKNGERFETIVKAKKDPRFEFLNDNHEFNKYYREKIKEYKEEDKGADKAETKVVKREKKIIAPVSFSIKKPKEDHPKEIKSALPVEESDEEESETPLVPPLPVSAPSLVAVTAKQIEPLKQSDESINKVNTSEKSENPIGVAGKNGLDVDDPLLEIIELTNDVEDRRESRRAEDRIKDKLAAAAREKLATMSKDKALQLERKRKAAEFLKLKSTETVQNGEGHHEKLKSRGNSLSDSVEIIDITMDKEPEKTKPSSKGSRRDKSWSREVEYRKSRSQSVDREYERRKKHRSRSRKRDKKKDSSEEPSEKRKKSHRRSRKKSHKRKHSKSRSRSKKKSKKHKKRSESENSDASSGL